MDAIQFLKTVGRICKRNNEKCDECPLDKYPCNAYINCISAVEPDKDIEEMVKIADRWAKEHPVKTRQSEFLKQFPNAQLNKDGVLVIDPCKIDTNSKEDDKCEALKTGMYSCSDCRKEYWLTEVTDND